MTQKELPYPDNFASSGDFHEQGWRSGLRTLLNRHPLGSTLVIFVADFIFGVIVSLIVKAVTPPIYMLPDFIALCILTIPTVILVSLLGWWRIVGWNRPGEWRNLKLLILPVLIVFLPLLAGFKTVDAGTVLFLLVGYLLTSFYEETLFRGVILRLLRPKGIWTAVLLSSLLFGLAHSSNILLRFSGNPVIVLLQMLGAFTFGIAMAALRLRTNTLWPLMLVHTAWDLFLAIGHLPILLVEPIRDTILLVYGLYLLRGVRREELLTEQTVDTEQLVKLSTSLHSEISSQG